MEEKREIVYRIFRFLILYLTLNFLLGLLAGQFILKEESVYLKYSWWLSMKDQKTWILLFMLFVNLLAVLLSLAYFRVYREERSFLTIGIVGIKPTMWLFLAALTGVLIHSIYFMFLWKLDIITGVSLNTINLSWLFSFSFILLLASLIEELVFRGYVLNSLLDGFPPSVSVIISATAFAAFHLVNPGMTPALLLNIWLGGLILGQLYLIGRNIWIPLSFHFFWNFTHIVILGNERHHQVNYSIITWEYADIAYQYNLPLLATYIILPFVILIFIYLYFRKYKSP